MPRRLPLLISRLALGINKVQNMVDRPFSGCDGLKEAIDVSSPDFGGIAPITALPNSRPEEIRQGEGRSDRPRPFSPHRRGDVRRPSRALFARSKTIGQTD